jgi:palmitoyltransferase
MSNSGIGQCVGARNHKFFLNFCFATSVFTTFVLSSVLFFIVNSRRIWDKDGIEPHFVILLALAALFDIFTAALFVSHGRLITHGQTTVESMYVKAIQDKDDDALARGFAWWECRYAKLPYFLSYYLPCPQCEKKEEKDV